MLGDEGEELASGQGFVRLGDMGEREKDVGGEL